MIVRITARRAGFRRCGIAHPAQPVDHPAERFSTDELQRLQAEPLLEVELLDDSEQQVEASAAPAPAANPNAKASAKAPAKAGK